MTFAGCRGNRTPTWSRSASWPAAAGAIYAGCAGAWAAVALQLGHRRSVDLDWFTPKFKRHPLTLARSLQDLGIGFHIEHTAAGTLHGRLGTVRVSLLEFAYPLLRRTRRWPPGACLLAS